MRLGIDPNASGTTNNAQPAVAAAVPPEKPEKSDADVKRDIRAEWEANFPAIQQKIDQQVDDDEKIRSGVRFKRIKNLIEKFSASPAICAVDIQLSAELSIEIVNFQRDLKFDSHPGGFAPGTFLSSERSGRSRHLPGPFQYHDTNLDEQLKEYARCLVEYPELKDEVIEDIAELLWNVYSEHLRKHPRYNSIFSLYSPTEPFNVDPLKPTSFPADSLQRAKERAIRLNQADASAGMLKRMVWAEWLLENRGTTAYKDRLYGSGLNKDGKPYSFAKPDRTKPNLAKLLEEAFFGEVDSQRR